MWQLWPRNGKNLLFCPREAFRGHRDTACPLRGTSPALSPESWEELCLHFVGLLSSGHLVGLEGVSCRLSTQASPRERRAQTGPYPEASFYLWIGPTTLLSPPQMGSWLSLEMFILASH